jgi:BirA family biotin operon repressor/biotin-[acetyl-CoA-carboxylase] ligase
MRDDGRRRPSQRGALPPDLAPFLELRRARCLTLGEPLTYATVTGSTNDDAKAAARSGAPHGALWVADAQTGGRGRQGRVWLAEPGASLLTSLLLRVACPAPRLPSLSLAVGLAVRDALAAHLPACNVQVKWPNDVLVDGRKIAGILVESLLAGATTPVALVVGVGVNLRSQAFPPDVAPRAVALAQLAEAAPTRALLLVDLLSALEHLVPLVAGRGLAPLLPRFAAVDALAGKVVTSEQGRGTAEGIDDEGRLLVRDDAGILRRWSAGEVHIGAGATQP